MPAAVAPAATERWSHGLDWYAILWIVLLHVGSLAAPFVFTWKGLLLFLVLSWLTGGLGVCLGYHRLMAHLSFQTYPVVRRILALLGALAGQGPPVTWIGVHRKHHQYTDILATRIRLAKALGGAMCSGSFPDRVNRNGPK